MTYHVAYITPHFIQYASDRLVTRATTPYDTAANKTVIFAGRDGEFVLGYTGVAYLGKRRVGTDQFIAEALLGQPIPDSDAGTILGPPLGKVPTIGYAFARLRQHLDQALKLERLPREDSGFAILAAGWQLRPGDRTSARPLLWSLDRCRHGDLLWRRQWASPGSLGARPALMNSTTAPDLQRRLDPVATDGRATAVLLSGEIRRMAEVSAARNRPTIGRDCMTVTLPHPSYLASSAVVWYVGDPDVPSLGAESFSPWVISAGLWNKPWRVTSQRPNEQATPVAVFPYASRGIMLLAHHGGRMSMHVQPRKRAP